MAVLTAMNDIIITYNKLKTTTRICLDTFEGCIQLTCRWVCWSFILTSTSLSLAEYKYDFV